MSNLAIVGKFGAGKSTVAQILVDYYRFTRLSFAGRLKQVAADVFGNGDPIAKEGIYTVTKLDGESTFLSGRQVLQELGQSVKALDREFWIRWLMTDVDRGLYGDGPFVIDDCRFPYEADALRARGFNIVLLTAPDEVRMERYELLYGRRPTEDEMNHPSEIEVDDITPDLVLTSTVQPELIVRSILSYDA